MSDIKLTFIFDEGDYNFQNNLEIDSKVDKSSIRNGISDSEVNLELNEALINSDVLEKMLELTKELQSMELVDKYYIDNKPNHKKKNKKVKNWERTKFYQR